MQSILQLTHRRRHETTAIMANTYQSHLNEMLGKFLREGASNPRCKVLRTAGAFNHKTREMEHNARVAASHDVPEDVVRYITDAFLWRDLFGSHFPYENAALSQEYNKYDRTRTRMARFGATPMQNSAGTPAATSVKYNAPARNFAPQGTRTAVSTTQRTPVQASTTYSSSKSSRNTEATKSVKNVRTEVLRRRFIPDRKRKTEQVEDRTSHPQPDGRLEGFLARGSPKSKRFKADGIMSTTPPTTSKSSTAFKHPTIAAARPSYDTTKSSHAGEPKKSNTLAHSNWEEVATIFPMVGVRESPATNLTTVQLQQAAIKKLEIKAAIQEDGLCCVPQGFNAQGVPRLSQNLLAVNFKWNYDGTSDLRALSPKDALERFQWKGVLVTRIASIKRTVGTSLRTWEHHIWLQFAPGYEYLYNHTAWNKAWAEAHQFLEYLAETQYFNQNKQAWHMKPLNEAWEFWKLSKNKVPEIERLTNGIPRILATSVTPSSCG